MSMESMALLTERVIGAAYKVSNGLGCGFSEKPYENALAHQLRIGGNRVEQQKQFTLRYEGLVVGEFYADLVVEETLIVELKAVDILTKSHIAQCLNYLRATGLKDCLLINFGNPRVEVRHIIPQNLRRGG